jgi:hypothetical protein
MTAWRILAKSGYRSANQSADNREQATDSTAINICDSRCHARLLFVLGLQSPRVHRDLHIAKKILP